MAFFFKSTVLDKFDVDYFKCANCDFVQTEDPSWLEGSYSEAITQSDIGIIRRNIMLSKITSAVINAFFNQNNKYLDYGGGYGLLVRIMRDMGFDFHWYDQFCQNLFAKGFEHNTKDKTQYELVTAFEVFEHLPNPLEIVDTMISSSKSILFTTELMPTKVSPPDTWWYYGQDHGQHISFYTKKTLSIIARQISLNLYTNGKSIHLLTTKKISPVLFNVVSKYKIAALLNLLSRRKSLMAEDYKKLSGRILS